MATFIEEEGLIIPKGQAMIHIQQAMHVGSWT
jgi:hypothetical protein